MTRFQESGLPPLSNSECEEVKLRESGGLWPVSHVGQDQHPPTCVLPRWSGPSILRTRGYHSEMSVHFWSDTRAFSYSPALYYGFNVPLVPHETTVPCYPDDLCSLRTHLGRSSMKVMMLEHWVPCTDGIPHQILVHPVWIIQIAGDRSTNPMSPSLGVVHC